MKRTKRVMECCDSTYDLDSDFLTQRVRYSSFVHSGAASDDSSVVLILFLGVTLSSPSIRGGIS